MKFSILIANYNNGKYFCDCYNSIISQSQTNWEAIIVDDGSTDDSLKIIKSIIGNDDRFKIIVNDGNYGCGFAKRKCVENASGDLCTFLDPDDALAAAAVEKAVDIFLKYPEIVLVHSNHFLCNESLKATRRNTFAGSVNASNKDFLNLDGKVTAFSAFRKNAYLKTEGIDAYMQRAVDQDLYLKMAETGKFYFLDECLYYYRQHDEGISTLKNAEKALFWHWYAVFQAAKRRGVNIENIFVSHYVSRARYHELKNSVQASRYYRFSKMFRSMFSTQKRKELKFS